MCYESPDVIEGQPHADLVRLEAAASAASDPIPGGIIDDGVRLKQLSRINAPTPPRRVDLGAEDPFGLLTHEDTYERMAGQLFDKCEGMYKKLAAMQPAVGKQVKLAQKNRLASVSLPTAALLNVYSYELTRTEDKASVQYLFHRTDKGYEDNGFRIIKKAEDDHVIVKNLDVHKTVDENDDEYFQLLTVAGRWIDDYALQMNLDPQSLRALASMELKPYTMISRAKNVGRTALMASDRATRPARELALSIATVKKRGRSRRPRFATLAVAAACVPISPGVLATDLASNAFNAVRDATKSGPSFDSHHYQLPRNSALPVGAVHRRVTYDPSLRDAVYNGAPAAGSKVGIGQIRTINPSTDVFDNNQDRGLQGIGKPNCKELPIDLSDAKSVRIVSANPIIGKGLSVTIADRALSICNNTHHVMHENQTHLFIQPEG